MSNQIKEALDIIQAKTHSSLETIANKIGLTRPYLSTAKKNGHPLTVVEKLKIHYKSELEGVIFGNAGNKIVEPMINDSAITARLLAENLTTIVNTNGELVKTNTQMWLKVVELQEKQHSNVRSKKLIGLNAKQIEALELLITDLRKGVKFQSDTTAILELNRILHDVQEGEKVRHS